MDEMTERLRDVLVEQPVTEKKMFGGVCFLYQGNMLCGVTKKGVFMARIDKGLKAEARQALPGSKHIDFTAKKMAGMLFVDEQAVESREDLQAWVDVCLRYVSTLPAK